MILSNLQRNTLITGKQSKKKQKRAKKISPSPATESRSPSPINDKTEVKAVEITAG